MGTTIPPSQVNAYLVRRVIESLRVECSAASQVVIKQGSAVGADDGSVVITAGSDITVDITNSGANGLDTGSEAANTWYYIWLIWNSTTSTAAGLFSASSTNPTLPSGYDKKRLIGAVRNNSSSNFIEFRQLGKKVVYGAEISLFTSDVATVSNGGTAISYASAAPYPIVTELQLMSYLTPGSNYDQQVWVKHLSSIWQRFSYGDRYSTFALTQAIHRDLVVEPNTWVLTFAKQYSDTITLGVLVLGFSLDI